MHVVIVTPGITCIGRYIATIIVPATSGNVVHGCPGEAMSSPATGTDTVLTRRHHCTVPCCATIAALKLNTAG